jgi:hypothetical protein
MVHLRGAWSAWSRDEASHVHLQRCPHSAHLAGLDGNASKGRRAQQAPSPPAKTHQYQYQSPGTPPPSIAGATTPFTTYQAPEAKLGGGANLASNTIINPWRNGIVISPPYYPAPSGNATITGNHVSGLRSGYSAFSNDSSGFSASLSNNSWQNSTPEAPFGGTAAAVPGTVQAANYDTGGQGVTYNVTTVNGTANTYRPDGVDLEACTDTGCGYDLGWTSPGQWFRYTVKVARAGRYQVNFRVAAPAKVTDALHLTGTSGDDLTGAVNIPATGGWQTRATITAAVKLAAGRHTLVVSQDNGGWNIHYLSFAPASA